MINQEGFWQSLIFLKVWNKTFLIFFAPRMPLLTRADGGIKRNFWKVYSGVWSGKKNLNFPKVFELYGETHLLESLFESLNQEKNYLNFPKVFELYGDKPRRFLASSYVFESLK
jgi:hypothetical protein